MRSVRSSIMGPMLATRQSVSCNVRRHAVFENQNTVTTLEEFYFFNIKSTWPWHWPPRSLRDKQEAHWPWRSAWEPIWAFAKVPEVAQCCTYTQFIPQGVKIELIFTLWAATVSGIRADFQNWHIWTWNLAIGQSTTTCTYTFYPGGSKLSLFSLYGQWFPRYRAIVKIGIGHETWPLAKVREVAHILFFYPEGLKLSLFSLYAQRFPRYSPIFKIAIFMHKTWPLAKVPEVAHILSFYPRGRNWA